MKKWFAGCGNVKLFELHKKVKVQFRGPKLLKKNGTLFQEESYLHGIFVPS